MKKMVDLLFKGTVKKAALFLFVSFFVYTLFAFEAPVFDKNGAVKDDKKKTFGTQTSIQIVAEMKTGWNLGNTLDATNGKTLDSETSWGQPKTTKQMFSGLAASGIKTVRIPVSWHNHLIDNNYTIDPEWMKRVKQIVDWAIDADLFVILNIHHDNYSQNRKLPDKKSGYYPTDENFTQSEAFLVNVWSQISLAFNNGYDEHLIFEILNEPRLCGTKEEWYFDKKSKLSLEAAANVNKLNQACLDVIRSSGGNNRQRIVCVTGLQASPNSVLAEQFKLPEDKEKNRLLVSVHMYSPYNFAMESPGVRVFTKTMEAELNAVFRQLHENFVSKGYPVIIDEYGATNKDNLEERVKWFRFFIKQSRSYGMMCCLWDNGNYVLSGKDYSEHFGYYNRTKQTWYFPEIIAVIREEAR